MPKTENSTFYNLKLTTADGQSSVAEYKSEKQTEEIKKEETAKGTVVEELKAQTFGVTTAESLDEILQVVPNAEVALGYFNYGLTLAQHNVKRELMKDAEWAPVEGVYDLLADVQTPREKRVADPLSTAKRAMKAQWEKLYPGSEPPTDEELTQALNAMFAGLGTPAATAA